MPPALASWVECAWSSEVTLAAQAAAVRPDGCLDIVYSPADGLLAIGAMTTQRQFDHAPGAAPCGVRFLPGMAREFLRVSPAELTDQSIPLEDLLGGTARELKRRLSGVELCADRARLLAASLRPPADRPNSVQRAITAIANSRGTADLDRISRHANLSPRQFRRRCSEESGLTPKHLCRILRFRHTIQLAYAAADDWAGIAAEAGYFDQAHLIRDFHEFTGQTPMAVFSNRRAGPVA